MWPGWKTKKGQDGNQCLYTQRAYRPFGVYKKVTKAKKLP